MSDQVKRTIASLAATILGSTIYLLKILSMQQSGRLKLTERLSDWGSVILILIGFLIVFQIIIHIVLHIVNRIVTNEDMPDLTDELDKLIELKTMQFAYWTFLAGFGAGLVTMVAGEPIWVMFAITTCSLVFSGIVGDLAKLIMYKRGG